MLYVTNFEEAAAAAAAGINMLSIEGRLHIAPEMREAAGDCFIQVGLPYGAHSAIWSPPKIILRAAFHFMRMGGDCFSVPPWISRKCCVTMLYRLSHTWANSLAKHMDWWF